MSALRDQVKQLAASGFHVEDIAALVELPLADLCRDYQRELSVGGAEAVAAVAQSLFRMATSETRPNADAAIFWLRCRGLWRDGTEAPGFDAGD